MPQLLGWISKLDRQQYLHTLWQWYVRHLICYPAFLSL